MENPSNKLSYTEARFESKPVTRLEDVWGSLKQVTTAPTWMPKKFMDGFAIYSTGGVYRLYVYDFTSQTWKYTALS